MTKKCKRRGRVSSCKTARYAAKSIFFESFRKKGRKSHKAANGVRRSLNHDLVAVKDVDAGRQTDPSCRKNQFPHCTLFCKNAVFIMYNFAAKVTLFHDIVK